MPYIKSRRREDLDTYDFPYTSGELNYVLTKEIIDYMGESPNYMKFNEVMGVLECVKQELYRRLVAPYEDKKCAENGDVFDAKED